jgi:isoleucyl-tRNA synthetase
MPKSFPQREQEVLAFWENNKVFEQTLKKKAPKGPFVFFEGPPTANGKPGIHHVESRAFKDCIPRFRTMQGYHVERKAGWDTHGLPVELEVEKQLGFKSKSQIEEFGIAEFNKRCRESVWTYLTDWREFTRRLGFWVDQDAAYVTFDPKYVESLWGVVKKFWQRGLLYQDYRVTPHCPRCGTSLSSHELAQGYQDVTDPAVFVKFRVTRGTDGKAPATPEFLVAWTTTPWTLPANVALAVGEKIAYVKVKSGEDLLWVAKERVEEATKGAYEIVEEREGEHLVGMEYEPLYPFVRDAIKGTEQEGKKAWYVVPADFVSTSDGSGIVHTAVMYGADDFELGTKVGLPKFHLVGLDGHFTDRAGAFAGKFVKGVDCDVIADLSQRGLLLQEGTIKHSYPFCWRCKSPVIYYAKDSWYVRMSSLRDELLRQNEAIHWEPSHIKEGRFGEWLREVKDWAFSRERYWGTPLPIWVCEECGEKTCIGSFDELQSVAKSKIGKDFDPHRPIVDEVEIACGKCHGTARRVSDVCDVWFDSGAMPFAQWHYPFENQEKIDKGEAYPADYISEAIDQTRGWFYTLLAVSTALGLPAPYKNVICLGHVLDAKGKKMSKSLGNVVNPMEMMEKYGADALRWYMYAINQPGESKRFDEKALGEMVKKVFVILDNVVSFYELYAQGGEKVKKVEHVLDRWILARLNELVRDVTAQLEAYQITEPVRLIAEFIGDLSTWYVRRSRDRFKSDDEADKTAAIAMLRECLLGVAKLMAPFAPFLAEDVYSRARGEETSVHLDAWPEVNEKFVDQTLLDAMARARSIVSKALERRAEAGKPIRQVLASMTVTLPDGKLDASFVDLLKDEVNVHDVFVQIGEVSVELDTTMTPELVREGTVREIIRRVNAMRKSAGLSIEDRIALYVDSAEPEVKKALEEHCDDLIAGTLSAALNEIDRPENAETFRANEYDITVGFQKV